MATISVNGVTYSGGRSVTITNGRVIVDGKDLTPDAKDIRIEVSGNVENITADACNSITVNGAVGEVSTQSGDVKCGDVAGFVSSMSGDIDCGNVRGNVKTMSGDISHR